MFKKMTLLILTILTISCSIVSATDFSKHSMVSPLFLRASETDTIFRNPAELTLHNRIVEGRLHYGVTDKKFGGMFLIHMPDNLPINIHGQNMSFPWGDFSFAMEFFGSNFGQNIMWVNSRSNNKNDAGGHYTIADGGYKTLFTWAKKTKYLTIGTNIKTYHYRDTKKTESERNAVGFDLGMFLTPLKDLYIGAVANDVGGTSLKDSNGNVIIDSNGTKSIVPQTIRFTAAIISGNDMSFSVGVPSYLIAEIKDRPKQAWKKVSFQGSKCFDNWLQITGGSNTQDLFGMVTVKISDFMDFSIIGARNLYAQSEEDRNVNYTLLLSAGYPIAKLFENTNKKPEKTGYIKRKHYHKTRKELRRENKLQRKVKDRRIRVEYEDNDIIDEIEDDLDDRIDHLKRKKRRLKKIKRRKQLEQELDDLDNDYYDEDY
ncbi:MAG: hypothetical protein GY730_05090 [bacterium]|nr:hypothetical protein [bacterium]